jgi:two-component system, LytTR family, sensor histidine kinase AlgZ
VKICWGGVSRVALWNIGGAILGVVAFANFGPGVTISRLAVNFAVGLLFSVSISTLCWTVLPRLGPFLQRQASPSLYWVGMIAAMLALATLGSAFALLLLHVLGLVETRLLLRELAASLKISAIVTLAIGIAITMIETLRGRLARATIDLRTKERDEAEARRLAAEAHLSSLESRVQPHFLFNTLNSIAALIPQDPAGAEKMTTQLASLLRSSLDAGPSPVVTLDQELKHVSDYLDIERVRFGARLNHAFEIGDGLGNELVPRFALQTLVENSVKYAVAPSRAGAAIRVSAQPAPRGLTLAVHDNGPGFDSVELPANHGLALLRERLALTFGDRGRLRIESHPGDSTVFIDITRAEAQP